MKPVTLRNHVIDDSRSALIGILARMHRVVRWDQLARANYDYHVKSSKRLLWSILLLLGVSLACVVGILFDGPKALGTIALTIPITLAVLRVDRKISHHFRASFEYRLSVAAFEKAIGDEALVEAIRVFEERCSRFDPCSE